MVLQLLPVLQPVLQEKINIQVTSLSNLSLEDMYDCNHFVTFNQVVNLSIYLPRLLDLHRFPVYNPNIESC